MKEIRELLCMVCGVEHPVWYAPNDIWNAVMRWPDGREASEKIPFICPTCFVIEAERRGIKGAAWQLTIERTPKLKSELAHIPPSKSNSIDLEKHCSIEGCDYKHYSKGWCNIHYQRWFRHGDPNKLLVRQQEKHGKARTPIYIIWRSIVQRCTNKNCASYKDYGGRGITMCDSWRNSFVNFYKDMGDVPKGMSIERIDNDEGYNPKNCRWATKLEQASNKRTTVRFKGKTRREWADHFKVYYPTFRSFCTRNGDETAFNYYTNRAELESGKIQP